LPKIKGASFSVIPIIALIGVLGLAVWAGYQLSVGSPRGSTSGDITEQDKAIQNLEVVKNALSAGLEFSSTQAALDIAENGGTESTTYWYCSAWPSPPEPDEVESAMTQMSLDYLNSYIDTLQDEEDNSLYEIEPIIPPYTCVGVADPDQENCNDPQNSINCEKFAFSASGEPQSEIEISEPVYVSDDADLEAYIDDNRFYWLYYNLYEDYTMFQDHSQYITEEIAEGCECFVETENGLVEVEEYISQHPELTEIEKDELRSNCLWGLRPGTVEISVEEGLQTVCEHYDEIFDEYVSCDWEVLCLDSANVGRCLDSECVRSGYPEICDTAPPISLQGGTVQTVTQGSVRFKVSLEDSKYLIASRERTNQKLVWNLNGAIQLEYNECPLLVYIPTGGAHADGGSQMPSAPSY
jgi:hypothetical protein